MAQQQQEQAADGAAATGQLERMRELLEALPDELEGEAREEALEAAERAAGRFMEAWVEEDWGAMKETLQVTWREHWAEKVKQDEPEPHDKRLAGGGDAGPSWKAATGGTLEGLLEQLMGAETVVIWTVEETELLSAVMVDVAVDVVLRDRMGQRHRARRRLRVAKERAAYEPAAGEDGRWGVNPVSARRQQ